MPFSVDISKKEGEAIADLYKSLVTISQKQDSNERKKKFAKDSLQVSQSLFNDNRFQEGMISKEFVFEWYTSTYDENTQKDSGEVFDMYIQN